MNLHQETTPARRALHLGFILAVCCSLRAQSTTSAPAPTAATPHDDPVAMSPFIVDSSEDTGWVATNSLTGTRLNTNLRDIASPLSVMTSQLLKDVAATNMQEAMLYSVNVENENEYAPDDGDGNSAANTNQNRIRGLAAGTPTRGFFPTRFRSDTYNTSEMSVASGPNAILFGIGSPAGIISSTQNVAREDRYFGSLGTRFDNNGSWRFTLDVNTPVIKNKLAIRADLLRQDQQTWKTPEFDDETRQYLALKATPFKGTTLEVKYEHMKDYRVHAPQALPVDNISQWIKMGKPLYNSILNQWSWDHGTTWLTASALDNWVMNKTNQAPGRDRVFIAYGNNGPEAQGLTWAPNNNNNISALSYDPTDAYNSHNTFSSGSIIDPKINYYGSSTEMHLHGEDLNIVLDQKIATDLYFEGAFNRETDSRYENEPYRYGSSSIQADVNYYLPGSTAANPVLNPNVGRYFIGGEDIIQIEPTTLESARAMLAYTPNFRRMGARWLGHWNFGVMVNRDSTRDILAHNFLFSTPGTPYYLPAIANNNDNITFRSYLNIPSLGGDLTGVSYPGPYTLPPWPTTVGTTNTNPLTHAVDTSELFMSQGYLLNDNLVLTFGVRRDRQTTSRSHYTDLSGLSGTFKFDGSASQTGVTRTYGAVWHTPLQWLSLTYSLSNEFNPQNNYVDINGKPLAAGTGVGQDVGAEFELIRNRLTARVGAYRNSSNSNVWNQYLIGYGGMGDYWSLAGLDAGWGTISRYARILGNTADIIPTTSSVYSYTGNTTFTRDYVAKGYELEMYFKPTDRWDVRLTTAKSNSVNSNYMQAYVDYVNARLPVWQKYYGYSRVGSSTVVDPNYATNKNSIGYYVLNTILPDQAFIKDMQGRKADLMREWRLNLMTDYRFSGRLAGLTVGGAWRWRSHNVIGYAGKPNPFDPAGTLMPDINRPVTGPSENFVDAWVGYERPIKVGGRKIVWATQLSVRNLLNNKQIVPIGALSDAGGTPHTFMQNSPITFIFSNTFKF